MTADSSTATVTPSGDPTAVNTPSGRKSLPSPWVHVVRGGIDPDSVSKSPSPSPEVADPVTAVDSPAPPEVSDNAGGVMKSVWSKPSVNGVVEGTTSPVMGADSWPALSESTRPGLKSSSVLLEASSATVSQAPIIPQQPPKQVKPNVNYHNNNPNHTRPRSTKRGGTGTGTGTGSASGVPAGYIRPPQPPPLPPPFPVFDIYGHLLPAVVEPTQPPFKANNWSPRPVEHTSNRHSSARRNNFGSRPFNNGRREHHGPRSLSPGNAGDVNAPRHMAPPPPPPFRGYFRPPFLFPQPVRPYGAPMGYEMGASYVYFPALAPAPYRGGAPVYPHGASVSSASMSYVDSSLHEEILKQVEYYFSDDNLVKDNYLRSHMDEEGWVPITLIAGFPKVQALINDIQMLLSVLGDSSTVEIQDDKLRRRGDWKKWIHTRREVTENSVEEASLQKLALEDGPTNEKQVLANGDVSIEDSCP